MRIERHTVNLHSKVGTLAAGAAKIMNGMVWIATSFLLELFPFGYI